MRTAFPQDEHLWSVAFAVIAVASLVIGNLAALVQTNVKRILAYSSVSHAGFMLIGLSAGSLLGGRAVMYYLIPYSAMAFGSFAVVAAREKELGEPVTLENLAGFGWERPFLGVAMWFFMFGFAGLPIGGGFVGKFYVLSAAYRHGWAWLVVVGVLATLVSLYYYLGVVRAMYMRGPKLALAGGSPPRDRLTHIAVCRRSTDLDRVAVRRLAADRPCAAPAASAPVLMGQSDRDLELPSCDRSSRGTATSSVGCGTKSASCSSILSSRTDSSRTTFCSTSRAGRFAADGGSSPTSSRSTTSASISAGVARPGSSRASAPRLVRAKRPELARETRTSRSALLTCARRRARAIALH